MKSRIKKLLAAALALCLIAAMVPGAALAASTPAKPFKVGDVTYASLSDALKDPNYGNSDIELTGSYTLTKNATIDTDTLKIGKTVHDHPILALSKLPDVFRQNPPEIAILCVPAAVAQSVTDLLVRHGVKSIWNFANVTLNVPEDVIVQREVIAGGLAMLSVKMKNARGAQFEIED